MRATLLGIVCGVTLTVLLVRPRPRWIDELCSWIEDERRYG